MPWEKRGRSYRQKIGAIQKRIREERNQRGEITLEMLRKIKREREKLIEHLQLELDLGHLSADQLSLLNPVKG